MVLKRNWIGRAVSSPVLDIRRKLVLYQYSFFLRVLQNMTYSPDTSPVDVNIVDNWVQLRSNVVVLAFWEDNVTSITTFAECLENVGNVVGCASTTEYSALRSGAMFCIMDASTSRCQWEDECKSSPETS